MPRRTTVDAAEDTAAGEVAREDRTAVGMHGQPHEIGVRNPAAHRLPGIAAIGRAEETARGRGQENRIVRWYEGERMRRPVVPWSRYLLPALPGVLAPEESEPDRRDDDAWKEGGFHKGKYLEIA